MLVGAGDPSDALGQVGVRGQADVEVGDHLAGRCRRRGSHDRGPALVSCQEPPVRRGHQLVERQEQVGLALPQPVGRRRRRLRQTDVAHHRARLLRQADLVETANVEAVEHGRSPEHLRHRDHAGTADARDPQRVVVGRDDQRRLDDLAGWRRNTPPAAGCRRTTAARASALAPAEPPCEAPRLGHGDSHERRAVSLEAGVVEVAGGLVDRRLASEVGLERLDRQTVRNLPAVAAALADAVVDHDAVWWRRHQAALAGAPRLGRANPDHGSAPSRPAPRPAPPGPRGVGCGPTRPRLVGAGPGRTSRRRRWSPGRGPRPASATSSRPRGPRADLADPGRRSWPPCRCRGACR